MADDRVWRLARQGQRRDANWWLDEPSGPNVLAWLREPSDLVRDVIGEAEGGPAR